MTSPNSSPKARILIAEDEPRLRSAIADALEAEGYRTLHASDGATALETAESQKPDLVLLDIMMPKADGISVCQALRRADCKTPILMLTAKGRVSDRVSGLDAGADDYLVKPFSSDELLARIRALLRRRDGDNKTVQHAWIGDTEIDFSRLTATREGAPIHLAPKEIAMLRLLVEANGEAVSRERFLDSVWGYGSFPTTRTVDNHIAKLRTKIEPDPSSPRWIKTVSGIGYRLEFLKLETDP